MAKEQGLFGSVLRGLRRLGSAFREKPTVALEDYEFEHFMLYHGLVGTSPEDQPQFKDVRADIFDAILKKSSVEMAIALKLPPLWWEDKLAAIFSEAHQYRAEVIQCLLPEEDPSDPIPDREPLRHTDWRVRANAAKILANMQITEAIPSMVRALEDTAETQKAAFCHIAYALAKLQNPQTRLALTKQLANEDNWLRVDTIGSLAKWPLSDVGSDIMLAMQTPNAMNDYAAVVIAKEHKPQQLFALQEDQREGALEVLIGLVQAVRGTFANDVSVDTSDIEAVIDTAAEICEANPTPRKLRAVLDAAELLNRLDLKQRFTDKKYAQLVSDWLASPANASTNELVHALNLASRFRLMEALPLLESRLQKGSPFLNESLETIGAFASPSSAPHVVRLIRELVDIDDRTSKQLSKQPLFEDDPQAAKTYWFALRALGKLPHEEGAAMLIKASKDYAADKRQQAVSALVELSGDPSITHSHGSRIADVMRESLGDPASAVRVSALSGVGKLKLTDVGSEVRRLANSKDPAVARQARLTLSRLF